MKEIVRKYCSSCKVEDTPLVRYTYRYTKEGKVIYMHCRKCNAHRAIEYRATKTGSKNTVKAVNRSIKKHPDKQRARRVLQNAIKRGHLKKRPCETCGDVNSQAHHKDYSEALNIEWLCAGCHADVHKAVL
jgi:hypothetical protein